MTQVDCENLQKLRCQPSSFQACPSEIGRTSSALASCPTFFFVGAIEIAFSRSRFECHGTGTNKIPGAVSNVKDGNKNLGPWGMSRCWCFGQRILYKDGYDTTQYIFLLVLCPSI